VLPGQELPGEPWCQVSQHEQLPYIQHLDNDWDYVTFHGRCHCEMVMSNMPGLVPQEKNDDDDDDDDDDKRNILLPAAL
jgi:hypothetical protein